MDRIGVALLGAGWAAARHAAALARIPGARLVGVASRTRAAAEQLARQHGAPLAVEFGALDELLQHPEVQVACVSSPNYLHARHALAAARAGRHALVEKPFCLTLREADALLEAFRASQTLLGYAENLCFAPHYRRARALIASGDLGQVRRARQVERHGGPYSDWFWRRAEAGGGALLDMGSHGVGCLLWLLGAPRVRTVRAELSVLIHREHGDLEDDARVILELCDGTPLVSESSWALRGRAESRLEVVGNRASLELDLLGRTGLRLHRPGSGWTELLADDIESLGYAGQMAHFLDCVSMGRAPELDGAAGRAVLEILLAAYASAGAGGQVVELP
jgi:predicted dehydrogenase